MLQKKDTNMYFRRRFYMGEDGCVANCLFRRVGSYKFNMGSDVLIRPRLLAFVNPKSPPFPRNLRRNSDFPLFLEPVRSMQSRLVPLPIKLF